MTEPTRYQNRIEILQGRARCIRPPSTPTSVTGVTPVFLFSFLKFRFVPIGYLASRS
jgi:hypothetical protein